MLCLLFLSKHLGHYACMYLMFNCVLLCFICATFVCERCYIDNIYIYIALLEMLFKLFFVLCCSEVAV